MHKAISKFVLPLFLIIFFLHILGFSQNTLENLAKAQQSLHSGNYTEVRDFLRPLLAQILKDNDKIVTTYFETFLERGEYQKGLEEIESYLIKTPDNPFLLHMKGRLLVSIGKYEEAQIVYQEAFSLKNDYPRNLLEIGELLEQTGERNKAYRIYAQIVFLNQQNRFKTADLLAITARAYAKLEDFHKANQFHNTAHQVDPGNIQNLYWWANLFLEKYNNADALRTFGDALSINKNKADLYLGYARATESFSQMEIMANKALEVNPNSSDALNMLAGVYIIDGKFDNAMELVSKALQINPKNNFSLANVASIYFLQNNQEKFSEIEQKVAEINAYSGEFYRLIAENCTRKVRYQDAVKFCYTAISKDRRNWKAYALLGSNLLRIGKNSEARRYLERGFKGDPFNLFARNTLELIDEYENFTTLESDHFSLIIHQSESNLLGGPVLKFAEECFDSLGKRYPYQLQNKIRLEAYNDHDDFAVRISGLPGIGLLGVCFGEVVAFDTPKAQNSTNYNWAQTLWHEIAHVMALGISDNKVPRWFTEGLSVYEESLARPQWGRKMELQLFFAFEEGLLLPLSEINKGFTRPKFPEQVILTYYQSAKYIEFLVNRFGFTVITEMLKAFAQGQNTGAAFQTVLNLDTGEVEKLLTEDLENQKKNYQALLINLPPMFNIDDEKKIDPTHSLEESNNPFFKNIHLGYKLLEQGNYSKAELHFFEAIKIFPHYTRAGNPYEGLAKIYRLTKNDLNLRNVLVDYLEITEYGASEAKELGKIFEEKDDPRNAIRYYLQSTQVDPYDINIYLRLADLYKNQGVFAAEIQQRQAILALEPVNLSDAQFLLAQSYLNNGEKSRAKRELLRALEIAPGFREAQKLLLKCVDE